MDTRLLPAQQARQGRDHAPGAPVGPLEHRVSRLKHRGEKDFICPPSQAEGAMGVISSQDKEFLVLDAEHTGLMASPVCKNEFWPHVRDWLEPRSR